jgi:hypothetical protein
LEEILIPQSSVPATAASSEQLTSGRPPLDVVEPGAQTPNRSSSAVSFLRRAANSNVKIPYSALQHLLAFFDALLIIFASMVGGGLYQVAVNGDFKNAQQLLGAGVIAAVLYVLVGQSSGFYDFHAAVAKGRRDVSRIVAQWIFVSLLLTLLAFLMKSGAVFSRGSILCFGSLALLLLLICRRFSKRLVATAVAEGQGHA